jgi:mannose/fructose/N-acetylgalactosamine-specific phosphotransferase system component IIC
MTYPIVFQIASLSLSAICWFVAAVLPTPPPMDYVSGPPEWVVRRIRWQSGLNRAGAIVAAIGFAIQAYLAWSGSSVSD